MFKKDEINLELLINCLYTDVFSILYLRKFFHF